MGAETQIRGVALGAFWDLESKDWTHRSSTGSQTDTV